MLRLNTHRCIQGLCLGLICLLSSGCATRALMSSDRYEKPAESQYQSQSIQQESAETLAQKYAVYQAQPSLNSL